MHVIAGGKTISSSRVKCTNVEGESPCDWEGHFYKVAIHNTMTCQHVPCKKQCKDERGNVRMIRKGEIDEHLMNDCPNRDYKCDICGESGTYADIIHGKACDGKPSTCPIM